MHRVLSQSKRQWSVPTSHFIHRVRPPEIKKEGRLVTTPTRTNKPRQRRAMKETRRTSRLTASENFSHSMTSSSARPVQSVQVGCHCCPPVGFCQGRKTCKHSVQRSIITSSCQRLWLIFRITPLETERESTKPQSPSLIMTFHIYY